MSDSTSDANPVSSSAPASFPPFFRRRTLGRAPSPPTWACYEQIPPPGSDSDECEDTDSDTQSESDTTDHASDHERYPRSGSPGGDMDMEMQVGEHDSGALHDTGDVSMEIDGSGGRDDSQDAPEAENACGSSTEQYNDDDCDQQLKRQDKGKQRAVEAELETLPVEKSPKKRHRKRRHSEMPFVYRPILTIKKSEGFVWNQDLFVPSYVKDRYIASTSPPSPGFAPDSPAPSSIPAGDFNDSYEVEVVEIRVQGNELDGIIS